MEDLALIKCGISGTRAIFHNFSNSEPSKQILDPLSCIIRLSLLIFKEKGSKISISNNKIYYQAPNLLQGALRFTYGDNRNDLHNLCNPIEKSVLWYSPDKNEDIRNIFKFAVRGLTRLKDAYVNRDIKVGESSLVCHSIDHYITIINKKLESNSDIDDNDNSPLKYLWNKNEILIINNLMILAVEKMEKNEDFMYAINAIESILDGKDEMVKKLVDKIYTNF